MPKKPRPRAREATATVRFVTIGDDTMQAVSFCARGRNKELSNLFPIKKGFLLHGVFFEHIEGAYVWMKKFRNDNVAANVLGNNGVLSSFEAYAEFVDKNPGFGLKVNTKWWKGADGILAKMIGNNSTAAKKLRRFLGMSEPMQEIFDEKRDFDLWRMLHEAKFKACPEFRDSLEAKRGKYIYEQDRHNGDTTKDPTWWGACFCKDGTFRGHNTMGKMLMAIRDDPPKDD